MAGFRGGYRGKIRSIWDWAYELQKPIGKLDCSDESYMDILPLMYDCSVQDDLTLVNCKEQNISVIFKDNCVPVIVPGVIEEIKRTSKTIDVMTVAISSRGATSMGYRLRLKSDLTTTYRQLLGKWRFHPLYLIGIVLDSMLKIVTEKEKRTLESENFIKCMKVYKYFDFNDLGTLYFDQDTESLKYMTEGC